MGKNLANEIREIILPNVESVSADDIDVGILARERLNANTGLTKDDDPLSHFCVYFAGYDPNEHELFLGHHKKANLWLFNGGHIDANETTSIAVKREIGEEWGVDVPDEIIGGAQLLTTTNINNPPQVCKTHFEIWYFIPLSKNTFSPKKSILEKEFYNMDWFPVDKAMRIAIDPNTRLGIGKISAKFD